MHITDSKHPLLTVDAVVTDENGKIILIRRKNTPFQGSWALPGGFVEYGETVEKAILREVKEETGILIEISELVGVYSDPGRDPGGTQLPCASSLIKKMVNLKQTQMLKKFRRSLLMMRLKWI